MKPKHFRRDLSWQYRFFLCLVFISDGTANRKKREFFVRNILAIIFYLSCLLVFLTFVHFADTHLCFWTNSNVCSSSLKCEKTSLPCMLKDQEKNNTRRGIGCGPCGARLNNTCNEQGALPDKQTKFGHVSPLGNISPNGSTGKPPLSKFSVVLYFLWNPSSLAMS